MHFSDDDLRGALRRKDPGTEFTERVMARIAQRQEGPSTTTPSRSRFAWLQPLRRHPAIASAVAVMLIVAGGIGYEQYRQNEIAKQREEIERQQEAARQTILALKIANQKLTHVFERVKQSETNDSKIRRQRL